MEFFKEKDGALIFRRRREFMEIRPWGSGFRIRSTENKWFTQRDWALLQIPTPNASIQITPEGASITSADSSLTIKNTPYGKVSFFDRQGRLLLKEYYRSWNYGTKDWKDLDQITMCRMAARTYKSAGGDNYSLSLRFESDDNEKIYGMGQYQQPYLNLKGCCLELAQKNTQASVPFMVSSKGYGLLWNNPAVGQAVFGMNLTEFSSQSAKEIDYWITAGDTPAEIVERYSDVTGKVPMMPEFALGFWQCKLRYETQEEVLQVAREYFRRQIPLSVIVIDFFHWPNQGDWTFDPKYFPDPEAMIKELDSMGIKLMVSIWPTVDRHSVHYQEMKERDLLIRTNRGIDAAMEFCGMESFTDVTNPEARDFIWQAARKNYLGKGVALFWLDEAEPEYTVPDFDNYRYYDGQALECANEYPACYARAFYEGMKEAGIENPINLIRCAWAGSQRFGALVWSGDVPSTFTYLRNQFAAGLNMGMAGIPWWTTDIGGFHGGNPNDPAFRELFARWFAWGCFCPVMRLHGDREPHDQPPMSDHGGGMCASGADNEVWSYGEEVYAICKKYLTLREKLRPYVRQLMQRTHETGEPIMRPMFFDFPEDDICWRLERQYMFGPDYLVVPVLEAGLRKVNAYLPKGRWQNIDTQEVFQGESWVEMDAPLDIIPVLKREKG